MNETKRPYELKSAIKKDRDDTSKTYWTTIGKAWPNSKGGFKIELAPGITLTGGDDVEYMIWPPYDKERNQGGSRGGYGDDDGSIPF